MEKPIITNGLVEQVLDVIVENATFERSLISYEIQDDYQLLIVFIPASNFNEYESFKPVAHLIDNIVPGRSNDYSWSVIFKRGEVVLNSYFGGNLDSPSSGL